MNGTIQQIRGDGVMLALSPSGGLKVGGRPSAVQKWLPDIRSHKPDIVACLQSEFAKLQEEARAEAFEERAAIMEFDGGLSREEAERAALLDVGGAGNG
jgi:hypothetical protein